MPLTRFERALQQAAFVATSLSAIFVGYQLYQGNKIERNKAFFAWQKADIIDLIEENGPMKFENIARKMSKKHRVMAEITGVNIPDDEETRMALLSLTSDGAVTLSDRLEYTMKIGYSTKEDRFKNMAVEELLGRKSRQENWVKLQRLVHENSGKDIDSIYNISTEVSGMSMNKSEFLDAIFELKGRGIVEIYDDNTVYPAYTSEEELSNWGKILSNIVIESGNHSDEIYKEISKKYDGEIEYEFFIATVEELRRDNLILKDQDGNLHSTQDARDNEPISQ